MYIINRNKIKLLLISVMLLLPNCVEKSDEGFSFSTYLSGNIRSFDFIDDTLFVASEDYGVMIYKINYDSMNRIV